MSQRNFVARIGGAYKQLAALILSAGASDAYKIAATGADGRWDYSLMPDRVRSAYFSMDFIGGITTNIWFGSGVNSGSTGTDINAGRLLGHPGCNTVNASSTAGSGYRLTTPPTGLNLAGGETCLLVLQTQNTPAGNTRKIMFGFTTTQSASDGTDEVIILIDSTGVYGRCANNGASTTSSNIYSIANDVFYRFKISVAADGNSVQFSVYSDAGVLLGTETVGTNVPANGSRRVSHGLIITSTGTTAGTVAVVDFMDVNFPYADRI